jgi:8-oxo-dGTP pyrophosphatase MutT (NUDIX family)
MNRIRGEAVTDEIANQGAEIWSVERIRRALQGFHAACVDDPPGLPRAAVALILRDGTVGSEFLAIHRAHRPGDPWSGHMALPGGRQQPGDLDLVQTAVRETCEEVGIDLQRNGEWIAELDELRAVGRGKLLDLVIRPIVFRLTAAVELHPNPAEVQNAFWIPLAALHVRHEAKPAPTYVPSFEYNGYTIWGLTHRILSRFLETLERDGAYPLAPADRAR